MTLTPEETRSVAIKTIDFGLGLAGFDIGLYEKVYGDPLDLKFDEVGDRFDALSDQVDALNVTIEAVGEEILRDLRRGFSNVEQLILDTAINDAEADAITAKQSLDSFLRDGREEDRDNAIERSTLGLSKVILNIETALESPDPTNGDPRQAVSLFGALTQMVGIRMDVANRAEGLGYGTSTIRNLLDRAADAYDGMQGEIEDMFREQWSVEENVIRGGGYNQVQRIPLPVPPGFIDITTFIYNGYYHTELIFTNRSTGEVIKDDVIRDYGASSNIGQTIGLMQQAVSAAKTARLNSEVADSMAASGFDQIDEMADALRDLVQGQEFVGTDVADPDLTGTEGNDLISGKDGDDSLSGGAGNDMLRGGEGADTLDGGADADRLEGGEGADVLEGGDGSDGLLGGAGSDTLRGGDGDDQMLGEAGADQLQGDEGNDVIDGGADNDRAFGGTGDDTLLGAEGNDRLFGAAGDDSLDGGIDQDYLSGGYGADTLRGGDGDDTLRGDAGRDDLGGGAGDDTLMGGSGGDRLSGDAGNDLVQAGAGADRAFGGAGNDTLDGGANKDVLFGGWGSDDLTGGDHDDRLFGGFGNDTLDGGAGADTLSGGPGFDELTGAQGADVFVFGTDLGRGQDRVTDFTSGEDQIHLDSAVFAGLGTGALDPTQLQTGPVATGAVATLIYAGGVLSYDADGAGGADAIGIARLMGNPTLDAADIFLS